VVELGACEVVLQFLELAVCVDVLGQVVDLADLDRLDLELVVLAFADDHTLTSVLDLVVLVVLELVLEAALHVRDHVLVVVDLILDVAELVFDFVLADDHVFEVVALHKTLELLVLVGFVLGHLHLVVGLLLSDAGVYLLSCVEALEGVGLVHVDVVDDVQDFVGLVDFVVLGDEDELEGVFVVHVLKAQVEDAFGVECLHDLVHTLVVDEAPAGVGERVEVVAAFGEVGGEAVELLDVGVLDLDLVRAVVALHELVLLFVLVLLLALAVVLELLLVQVVDQVDVVLDFAFEADGHSLLLARLEVGGHLDLVVLVLQFAEDLVALNKVLADLGSHVVFN